MFHELFAALADHWMATCNNYETIEFVIVQCSTVTIVIATFESVCLIIWLKKEKNSFTESHFIFVYISSHSMQSCQFILLSISFD